MRGRGMCVCGGGGAQAQHSTADSLCLLAVTVQKVKAWGGGCGGGGGWGWWWWGAQAQAQHSTAEQFVSPCCHGGQCLFKPQEVAQHPPLQPPPHTHTTRPLAPHKQQPTCALVCVQHTQEYHQGAHTCVFAHQPKPNVCVHTSLNPKPSTLQPTCALVCVGVPPGRPHAIIGLGPRGPVQHRGLEGQLQGSTQRPVCVRVCRQTE